MSACLSYVTQQAAAARRMSVAACVRPVSAVMTHYFERACYHTIFPHCEDTHLQHMRWYWQVVHLLAE